MPMERRFPSLRIKFKTSLPSIVFSMAHCIWSLLHCLRVGQEVFASSTDTVPNGIRDGQVFIVDSDREIPANFEAGRGGRVFLQEGARSTDISAVGSTIVVEGKNGGRHIDAFEGSRVHIAGNEGAAGEFTSSPEIKCIRRCNPEFRRTRFQDKLRWERVWVDSR